MGYEYDVFLSYRNKFPIPDWIEQYFLPHFEIGLSSGLGRDIKIFFDRTEIKSGDQWKARIKGSLVKSRVLVAVWSPTYFHSEWCVRELGTMMKREKLLGLGTPEKPTGLIFPIKGRDGVHFPDYAMDIQQRDFKKFLRIGEGFSKTERFVEFQDAMETWTEEVAEGITKSPDYDNTWMALPDITISLTDPLIKLPVLE